MASNVVKFLITGDAAGYLAAAEKVDAANSKITGSTDQASKKSTKSSGAMTAGLIGAGIAVAGFAKKSIDAYDSAGRETIKLERLTGGTAEQMSGLRFAAQQTGVQFTTLAGSVTKFSKGLQTAPVKATLDQLGVASVDATGKTRPYLDILKDLADKFQSMPAGIDKNRIAVQLFGKSGADMEPLLNKGSAGIQQLIDKGKSLGVVFKDDSGIRKQIQAQRDFQAAVQGLEIQVGAVLTPVLTGLSETASTVVGAFTKLPGPMKEIIEIGGGLAITGVAISKAWSALGPVKDAITALGRGISNIGVTSQEAAGEVEAAASQESAAVAAFAATNEAAILGVVAGAEQSGARMATFASANADAIGLIGTSAEEAATEAGVAFTNIEEAAAQASSAIAAFAASNDTAISAVLAGASDTASYLASFGSDNAEAIGTISSAAHVGATSVTQAAQTEKKALADVADQAGKTRSALSQISTSSLPGLALVGGAFLQQKVDADDAAGSAKLYGKALQDAMATGSASTIDVSKSLDDLTTGSKHWWEDLAQDFAGPVAPAIKLGSTVKDAKDRLGEFTDQVNTLAAQSPAGAKAADQVVDSLGRLAKAQLPGADQNKKLALDYILGQLPALKKGIDDTATAADKESTAESESARTTQEAAAAAETAKNKWSDYAKTLHAIADPIFGAEQAQDTLTQAQQKTYLSQVALTGAVKEYGPKSKEAQQATIDFSQAQQDQVTAALGQQSALAALKQGLQEGTVSTDLYRQSLQSWVAQGIITQGEMDQQLAKVGLLNGSLNSFDGKHVQFTMDANTDEALNKIHFLQLAIQNAARTSASAYVSLTGHTQSTQGVTHSARGNFLRAGQVSEVTEGGSELWREGGKTYLIPGSNGTVVSNGGMPKLHPSGGAGSYAAGNVTFGPGSVTFVAAPGEDPYEFGMKAMDGLLTAARQNASVKQNMKQLVQ